MKRLLMISYPFPPNASAGAFRSERFARYLQEYGWAVDVVTPKIGQGVSDDEHFAEKLGSNVQINRTVTLDPWLWLLERIPKNWTLRVVRSVLMKITSFPDHMIFWVPFAAGAGVRIW